MSKSIELGCSCGELLGDVTDKLHLNENAHLVLEYYEINTGRIHVVECLECHRIGNFTVDKHILENDWEHSIMGVFYFV